MIWLALAAAQQRFHGPCGSGLVGFYKGAENAAVCCNASCGRCVSDAHCGKRPGGRTQCCPGVIRRSTEGCGVAPCPLRGKCKDWKPLLWWRSPFPKPTFDEPAPDFRVLLLIPAGRNKASIVADTIRQALDNNVSVFLAHYDGSSDWYRATYDWYDRLWATVNYTDFKANYVRNELLLARNREIQAAFSHVWVADDDVRFGDVAVFLRRVRDAQPLIAQPAITGSWQRIVSPEHAKKLACDAWATDFVEVMAPIMRADVLFDVYARLLSTTSHSDWGTDMVWCKYAERRFKRASGRPACLVVDAPGFQKAGRVTARRDYFRVYAHSYETQASLWDKRCIKHNLRPLWTRFRADCHS